MDASVQCNLLSSVVNSDASVQCDFVPVPLVTSTPRRGFIVQSESDISEFNLMKRKQSTHLQEATTQHKRVLHRK